MSESKRDEFWDGIERSAELVKDAPTYTQAGLVVSENFVGPHSSRAKTLTRGEVKAVRVSLNLGYPVADIAMALGVTEEHVQKLARARTRRLSKLTPRQS